MRSRPYVFIGLVACGGSGSEPTLLVHAKGNVLVAAREAGGEWRALSLDAAGDATVTLGAAPYEVAGVCELAGSLRYRVVRGGLGLDEVELPCIEAPAETVELTIAAPPATDVYVGSHRFLGGRTDSIAPGTYDVAAFVDDIDPPRFEIRRGVELTSATTLAFDLVADGAPMLSASLVLEGLDGEQPLRFSQLTTPGGLELFAAWRQERIHLIPPSALIDGDRQVIRGVAGARGTRERIREVRGDEATFTMPLPDAIEVTVLGPPEATASWQSQTAYDDLYLGLTTPDFATRWEVAVRPEWVAAGGEASPIAIPDPHEIPGWDPAWDLASSGLRFEIRVSRADGEHDAVAATQSGTLP